MKDTEFIAIADEMSTLRQNNNANEEDTQKIDRIATKLFNRLSQNNFESEQNQFEEEQKQRQA